MIRKPKVLTKCLSFVLAFCCVVTTVFADQSFVIMSYAEENESVVYMQDFETVAEGAWDKVYNVGGTQSAYVTTENPLQETKSLVLKNNSDTTAGGANGLFVSIEEAFGSNNIALRVKRNDTSNGAFRIVVNTLSGGTAHSGFTKFSTADAVAYKADGTQTTAISYNSAWEGYDIPANFDGYIFIENTENVDITSLSLGMAHNSFPANTEIEIMLDCVASYTGDDYSAIINLMGGPEDGSGENPGDGGNQNPENTVTDIEGAIADVDGWYISGGSKEEAEGKLTFKAGGYSIYQNKAFGEESLKFNINATTVGWPSIVFRATDDTKDPLGNGSSCYIIVLYPNSIELQRFNNGNRRVLYGTVPGFDSKFGDGGNPYFNHGNENTIEIIAKDTTNGVHIQLKINGYVMYDCVDDEQDCLKGTGYFGTYQLSSDLILSNIDEEASEIKVGRVETVENFESMYEGDYSDKWMVGGTQSIGITSKDALLGNNSLIMKNNSDTGYNGANGLYATVTKQFGTNGIVVRVKRNDTSGGAFRFVANSTGFAHQGFTKFSTASPIAYNQDGTINNELTYDSVWDGLNIPANFDGYIFMPNNEQVNISSISFGMFHNSFPANTDIEIMLDSIASYIGEDYEKIIDILEEESQGEDVDSIAAGITSIKEINYGQKSIIFPSVPGGTTISIESSSDVSVIDLSGSVYQQSEDKEVQLTFCIKDNKTGNTAVTAPIKVVVPAKITISEIKKEDFLNQKYGLFVHYVPSLTVNSDGTKVMQQTSGTYEEKLEAFAKAFDVEQFVKDVKDMNMQYVIFTAWHAQMIALYPSEAMVNHGLSNHQVSNYDLIGKIIDSLKAEGIEVYLYTHPRDGHDMTAEDAAKVGWATRAGSGDPNFDEFDYEKWNDFINDVYGELIDKYGDKISGLFVDEGSSAADSYRVVDYNRLYKTIKSKNPDLVLMHNFYGTTYGLDIGMKEYFNWCEFDSAESNRWPSYEIPTAIGISEAGWWAAKAENVDVCKYNPDDMFRYTILQSATNTKGGGTAWAAGPYSGGGWEKNIKEYLVRVGELLEPIEESVINTRPSESFPTKSGSTLGTVDFVANKSVDGKYEYIHILNSPTSGNTITLGAPNDGVTFNVDAEALNDGTKFEVITNEETGEVSLKFVGSKDWSKLDDDEKLDYVVKLTVETQKTTKETYEYIDNTDTSIRYKAGSWTYERWYRHNNYSSNWENTVGGDYEADITHSSTPGAYFEVPFEGTGITYMPCKNSGNTDACDIYIDGELVASGVSLKNSSYIPQAEVFSKQDLHDGAHILKVVNTGSGRLVSDVVRVTKKVASVEDKADKQELEKLIETVEKLDLSKYTDSSAKTVKDALKAAKDVIGQDLSAAEQIIVDNALKSLESAKANLKLKENHTGNGGSSSKDPSDKKDGSDGPIETSHPSKSVQTSKVAKTGDSANILVYVLVMLLCAGAVIGAFVFSKKKRN